MDINVLITFLRSIWPDVCHREGCYVRYSKCSESQDIEILDEWLRELNGDRRAVERAVNHCHIDNFFGPDTNVSHEELRFIGRLYKAMLRESLARSFPEEKFDIITNDAFESDEDTYVVTFCKNEKSNNHRL